MHIIKINMVKGHFYEKFSMQNLSYKVLWHNFQSLWYKVCGAGNELLGLVRVVTVTSSLNDPYHIHLWWTLLLTFISIVLHPSMQAMKDKNSGQPWYVDAATFRRAIAPYPSLQAAIFPPPPTTATPAQSQDISLYQLLHVSDSIFNDDN